MRVCCVRANGVSVVGSSGEEHWPRTMLSSITVSHLKLLHNYRFPDAEMYIDLDKKRPVIPETQETVLSPKSHWYVTRTRMNTRVCARTHTYLRTHSHTEDDKLTHSGSLGFSD